MSSIHSGARRARRSRATRLAVGAVAAMGVAALATACTTPATFVVDVITDSVDANPGDGTCADAGGDCSLRAAIMEANAHPGLDLIELTPGADYTIGIGGFGEDAGATGDYDITEQVRIVGDDSSVSADGADRVFDVHVAGIGGLTLEGIEVNAGIVSGAGGGIRSTAGSVALTRTTVGNNQASGGAGGIDAPGQSVVLIDSLVWANEGSTVGGVSAGQLISKNSSLLSNIGTVGGAQVGDGSRLLYTTIADSAGTGLAATGGTVEVGASIIGDQFAAADCSGTLTSLGYNVDSDGSCGLAGPADSSGTSPELLGTNENGGPTLTSAPGPASPALDRVPAGVLGCGGATVTDQRGFGRPIDHPSDVDLDAECESGAVEIQPPASS